MMRVCGNCLLFETFDLLFFSMDNYKQTLSIISLIPLFHKGKHTHVFYITLSDFVMNFQINDGFV